MADLVSLYPNMTGDQTAPAIRDYIIAKLNLGEGILVYAKHISRLKQVRFRKGFNPTYTPVSLMYDALNNQVEKAYPIEEYISQKLDLHANEVTFYASHRTAVGPGYVVCKKENFNL